MKSDPEKTLDEAMADATRSVDRAILGDLSEGSLSPEAILNLKKRGDITGSSRVKEVPLYTISEGFFKKRSVFLDKNPQLRELMNEIRDPKVLFTQTISDLGKFIGTNNLYKSMARTTADGGFSETFQSAIPKIINWLTKAKGADGKLLQAARPLIVKGQDLTPQQIADLQAAGYKQLGKSVPQKSDVIEALEKEELKAAESGKPFSKDQLKKNQKVKQEELDKMSVSGGNYGALSGDYVAPEIFNSLTIPTRTGGIGSELLAVALQGKGLSQIAKTVLNPLAQVRNFLSGVFMVGANGNIARNMDLSQSMSATFGKVSNLSEPEFREFYELLGDIGIR